MEDILEIFDFEQEDKIPYIKDNQYTIFPSAGKIEVLKDGEVLTWFKLECCIACLVYKSADFIELYKRVTETNLPANPKSKWATND